MSAREGQCRLVQMCLRLLRAEIWSLGTQTKRLSRVSACVVDDSALSHPVVIAHGRIVVLGGDNHRLHEEIITAAVLSLKAALAVSTLARPRPHCKQPLILRPLLSSKRVFKPCGASSVILCLQLSKLVASSVPRILKGTSRSWPRRS